MDYKYTYQTDKDDPDAHNWIMIVWADKNGDITPDEEELYSNEFYHTNPLSQNWIDIVKKESKWVKGEKLYIDKKINCDGCCYLWWYKEKKSVVGYAFVLNKDGKLWTRCYNMCDIMECDDDDDLSYSYMKIFDTVYNNF